MPAQPKKQIILHKKLDGEIQILWNNKPLEVKELIYKMEVERPLLEAA